MKVKVYVGGLVVLVGAGVALGVGWHQIAMEPACRSQLLTQTRAKVMVADFLAEQGYDRDVLSKLEPGYLMVVDTAEGPVYQFEMCGVIGGQENRFSGFATNCGIEEVFDTGSPPNVPLGQKVE